MKTEQIDHRALPALFDVPKFSAEQIQKMQKLQLSFQTSQTRHRFPAGMFKQIVIEENSHRAHGNIPDTFLNLARKF